MTTESILVDKRAGYRVITLIGRTSSMRSTRRYIRLCAKQLKTRKPTKAAALLVTVRAAAFARARLERPARQAGRDCRARWRARGALQSAGAQVAGLPFPVVAAVNAALAAGAGCNIALACDIVLGARSASFVQSFARVGLVPIRRHGFLPRLVGEARARGLALLAEPLSAEKAEQWGLIWKCVDDAALANEAQKLCEHFATAPTQGLALIKRASTRPPATRLTPA
jgi:2-(1,2-epoxy-1,2-dihydrophenyl)acetyl-CoA isomerase